jgi:NOL1/NOP2/fmu family ribosome biogenesis protein
MTLHIFSKQEKQEILEILNQQFGIKEIPGILIKIGKERIFLYQGSLNEDQLKRLEDERIFIERVGIYFGKIQEDGIRLSIDGANLMKDQITKNIFEITEEQVDIWMHGSELNVSTGLNEFVIIKHKNDFLGTGKASQNKITNFIPKARRLKFKG